MTEAESGSEVCVTFCFSRAEFDAGMHRMFWVFWQCSGLVVVGVLACAAAVGFTLAGDPSTSLPTFALAALWLGFAAWIYFVSPGRQFRQRPRLKGEQTHCFADGGCTARFVDAETRLQWSVYGEIIETRNLYLLRMDRRGVNIIPKRAFADEDESRFRQLSERHTKVEFRLGAITA
ncbi:MAG TPA: YcxB family protein [Candidatus Dormibacteraeota bacterium]|nr:YcxB family protein [Candidatus Dormibacteraeota bacterium]